MGQIREQWKSSEHGDEAVRLRNARARELRKQGYTVKCSTWDFTDLAREVVSILVATPSPHVWTGLEI